MSIEYVKIACASPKLHRFDLEHVYRATDRIIATDGHRLHFKELADKVEKEHFIDGYEGCFPAWDQVMPKGKPEAMAVFPTDKESIAKLKAFVAFYAKTITDSWSARVLFARDTVRICSKNQRNNSECAIEFKYCQADVSDTSWKDFDFGINPKYLLDAVELPSKNSVALGLSLEFYGELRPIIIKSDLGNALIMPMR